MLMRRSTSPHKNPNLVIALCILIVSVIAVVFASPAIKNRSSTGQDGRIVKSIDIKELGIQLGLTETLKNLKYEAQNRPLGPESPSRQIVTISFNEYTDLANKCTGVKVEPQIFKSLAKVDGQAGKNTGSTSLKQLKDYYIVALDGGLPSTDACQKSKDRPALEALYKKLNTQLNNSVKSAKPL